MMTGRLLQDHGSIVDRNGLTRSLGRMSLRIKPVTPRAGRGLSHIPVAQSARRASRENENKCISTSLRGAKATKQSTYPRRGRVDCFAEPLIGRAFARSVGLQ